MNFLWNHILYCGNIGTQFGPSIRFNYVFPTLGHILSPKYRCCPKIFMLSQVCPKKAMLPGCTCFYSFKGHLNSNRNILQDGSRLSFCSPLSYISYSSSTFPVHPPGFSSIFSLASFVIFILLSSNNNIVLWSRFWERVHRIFFYWSFFDWKKSTLIGSQIMRALI